MIPVERETSICPKKIVKYPTMQPRSQSCSSVAEEEHNTSPQDLRSVTVIETWPVKEESLPLYQSSDSIHQKKKRIALVLNIRVHPYYLKGKSLYHDGHG